MDNGYRLLCLAITQRAINDYLFSIKKIQYPKFLQFLGVKTDNSDDIRDFFLSDWFKLINPFEISGREILNRLDDGEFTEPIEVI